MGTTYALLHLGMGGLLVSNAFAAEEPKNPCDAKTLSAKVDHLEKIWPHASIYYELEDLKPALEKCSLSEKNFGLNPGTFKLWALKGDRACYRKYENSLEQSTQLLSGDALPIANAKIEEWKSCAERIGMAKSENFKKDYSYYKNRLVSLAAQRKEACLNKDLRNLPGLGDARHQGESHICKFFSTADVVSSELGQKISAIDLALQSRSGTYSQIFDWLMGYNVLWGGFDGSAEDTTVIMESSNVNGYCLEDNLRSDNSGRESFMKLYRILESSKEKRIVSPSKLSDLYKIAHVVAPKMSLSDFISCYQNSSVDMFFQCFRNKACEPRLKAKIKGTLIKNREEGLKAIHDQLKLGKIVSYGGYATCLYYGGFDFFDGHEMTIVGSRWNEGAESCELFVRNSWGKSWKENGGKWVDETNVYKCMNEVVTARRLDGVTTPETASEPKANSIESK